MIMRPLLLCALFAATFACESPSTPAASPGVEGAATAADPAMQVDGPKAKAMVAKGATLIDVRSSAEFEQGHIKGARNHPVGSISDDDFGPKDTGLIVYCSSGKRSAEAATKLRAKGYTRVFELGDMGKWPSE